MISVSNLTVKAGDFCLENVSFQVPTGGYAVLMGRSGSGKTTLLETICGLRRQASGRIQLAGRDVSHLKPAARSIGYVPQDGALFSAMTVRDQLCFSLVIRKVAPDHVTRRTSELAELLEITHILNRRPAGLSGGEAQRVALGRALAFEPATLLLDEPLSALDDNTRDLLVDLLIRVTRHEHVTVLHVTHNLYDAERLADWVLRTDDGQIHCFPRSEVFAQEAAEKASASASQTRQTKELPS